MKRPSNNRVNAPVRPARYAVRWTDKEQDEARGVLNDRPGSIMLRVVFMAVAASAHGSFFNSAAGSSGDDSKYEVISQGAEYGRLSVGCSRAEVEFSGRLLFRSRGSSIRPLPRATFAAINGWEDPTTGEISTSNEGTFRVKLPVWNHVYSTRREGQYRRSEGRSRVTVSATGCKSQTFKVGPDWRPKILVLKCPDRAGEE